MGEKTITGLENQVKHLTGELKKLRAEYYMLIRNEAELTAKLATAKELVKAFKEQQLVAGSNGQPRLYKRDLLKQ